MAKDWTPEAPVPRVRIRWKGTDICFDFDCQCGSMPHYDGYNAYAIECPDCGRKYELPIAVALLDFSDTFEPVLTFNDDGSRWDE